MKKNDLEIIETDIENEQVRQNLITYLAPYETKALFLLGNLQNNFQPAFIYTARQNGQMVGVCGFYPTFQSCTIFSENADASRAFAQMVLKKHTINALLGMADMIKPAYDEFIAHGRRPVNSPENLFFELSMENFKPYHSHEGIIRPVEEQDVDAAVRLHRLIHSISTEQPITEEERAKIRLSSVTFCMEINEKIVAIASSNGLAIRAFQILGVATDPAFRRKGYAKAVCSHLIRYMKQRGAARAIIFTGEENIAARKCYLDLGFQITDRYCAAIFQPASS